MKNTNRSFYQNESLLMTPLHVKSSTHHDLIHILIAQTVYRRQRNWGIHQKWCMSYLLYQGRHACYHRYCPHYIAMAASASSANQSQLSQCLLAVPKTWVCMKFSNVRYMRVIDRTRYISSYSQQSLPERPPTLINWRIIIYVSVTIIYIYLGLKVSDSGFYSNLIM